MSDDVNARMSEAWRVAAESLGIRVTAPYEIGSISFAAYLPDFGGHDGMVVGPFITTARSEAAAEAGLYLSRSSDSYADFNAELFKDTLNDWSWYGTPEDRPAWYSGAAWTS